MSLREHLLRLRLVLAEQGYATDQPWPFHTDAARLVWATAQKIALKSPDMPPETVLYQAAGEADIAGEEMTPEDRALVMMAVRWLRGTEKDAEGKSPVPLKLFQYPPTKW